MIEFSFSGLSIVWLYVQRFPWVLNRACTSTASKASIMALLKLIFMHVTRPAALEERCLRDWSNACLCLCILILVSGIQEELLSFLCFGSDAALKESCSVAPSFF